MLVVSLLLASWLKALELVGGLNHIDDALIQASQTSRKNFKLNHYRWSFKSEKL